MRTSLPSSSIPRALDAADFARSISKDARKVWDQTHVELLQQEPWLFEGGVPAAWHSVERWSQFAAATDDSTVVKAQHVRIGIELWRYSHRLKNQQLELPSCDETTGLVYWCGKTTNLGRKTYCFGIFNTLVRAKGVALHHDTIAQRIGKDDYWDSDSFRQAIRRLRRKLPSDLAERVCSKRDPSEHYYFAVECGKRS
ncbi:helix-turn-helix domain-containing protein [Novipirellula artificiosorum]|uniref:Uncharacterized protein n=1 Tax=Novipirellula artificiosorum TaxID=2528016 RepID=A0A5C6CDB9_9BACT|nr:hypothetical protein [Novipirellula artificiosorum]TWU22560.1 hypothetical protein Poly41_71250 [Novipirellula artificiosorum]